MKCRRRVKRALFKNLRRPMLCIYELHLFDNLIGGRVFPDNTNNGVIYYPPTLLI